MFIRIKKIKNKEYAYLVANKWKDGSSRQTVKSYLGSAYKPEKINDYIKINNNLNFKELILDIVKQELLNHGFEEGEILKKDKIIIDLRNLKFIKNKKGVVIALNEGFLCNHTLKELLNFKSKGHEEEVGVKLATMLVETGIRVPKEEFIHIFEKVFKG